MRTYFIRYQNLILSFVMIISLLVCLVCDGFAAADSVREESLRLHVKAASDSETDQRVKLLVRDAVLQKGAEFFSENTDAHMAAQKILENKEELENIANAVLRENGVSYRATVGIEEEYFETRQYENVKLPAGKYTACKVVLGDGEGQNWWCIMFPPLCLPAATQKDDDSIYAVYGENGGKLVTEKSGYKIKFRIVEIVQELIESIKEKS